MLERISDLFHLHDLGIRAALDIVLLAILIYNVLLLIRGTRAVHILTGVLAVGLAQVATRPDYLDLPAMNAVLGQAFFYIPFALVVLFQNQIRQALTQVGRNPLAALRPRRGHEAVAEEIALAAASLASKRLGALIVIERELGLRAFYETGIVLEAQASYDLLLNIFQRGAPLHDGAVIVSEDRIKAASCYLPLTTDPTLSRTYGTRHRAAIGITQESDALAIVVSEERGIVSVAESGRIVEGLDAAALYGRLRGAMAPRGQRPKPARSGAHA
jgi:uncharacterized protein (TIGR00159 family)